MQFVHTKEAVQEAENDQDPLAALKGIKYRYVIINRIMVQQFYKYSWM